jgi:hypothetical protein
LAQLKDQLSKLLDHAVARISCGQSISSGATETLNRVVSGERLSPDIRLIGHGASGGMIGRREAAPVAAATSNWRARATKTPSPR